MTPKAHALLSSIAASMDGGVDMARARLATLDGLEAGQIPLEEALQLLRDGFLSLGQIVGMMYDTAAVLAEPMSIPSAPAPVEEAAPSTDTTSDTDTKADEPQQSSADPGAGLYPSRRKGDRTAV